MQGKYDVKAVMNAMSVLNDSRREYLQTKKTKNFKALEQQEVQEMEHALQTGELSPNLQRMVGQQEPTQ